MGRWSQYRHRGRVATSPALPTILIDSGSFTWGTTSPGWADVEIGWSFPGGSDPTADIEIWEANGYAGLVYSLIDTIPGGLTSYIQTLVADADDRANYKLRYVKGSQVGAWSNEYFVEIVS